MNNFILLGTEACHLCEQAEKIIKLFNINYQKIDIAEHTQWQAEYAVKIPVLLEIHSKKRLCWPFTNQQVEFFLKDEGTCIKHTVLSNLLT